MHRFFVGGRLLRSLRGFSHPLPDPPPLRRGGGFKLQTAPRACLQFVLRAVTTRVAAIFRPHPNPSPKGTGTARAAREGLILLNCKQPPGRCGRRERRAFYSHPPQVSGKARRNRRHHPDCAPRRTIYGGFCVRIAIAIHRKPHTVLRRLTGHPKKWRSHFLGKPAPYNRVLSSATRLV